MIFNPVIFHGGTASVIGKLASEYAVGESVFLAENGVLAEYLVVHQGLPDTSLYDASCDGTWLLRKDIKEKRQWHSSRVNDYANSDIHTYLNSSFLDLFDSRVQSTIVQAKIPYVSGNSTDGWSEHLGASGLPTKIFLLSELELGVYAGYFETGAKLDYFDEGGTYWGDEAANIKRRAYLEGAVTEWWLRVPSTYNHDDRAVNIQTYGYYDIDYYVTYEFGIRPALILPSDAKFDPSTNTLCA